MLPLASRRHLIEHTLIVSYAVAVAMTTVVATTAIGAMRAARDRKLRAAEATSQQWRLRDAWRR